MTLVFPPIPTVAVSLGLGTAHLNLIYLRIENMFLQWRVLLRAVMPQHTQGKGNLKPSSVFWAKIALTQGDISLFL